MPVYEHGFWQDEPIDGQCRHLIEGRYFQTTFSEWQESVNRFFWALRRGVRVDTDTACLPVTTDEVINLMGNDSYCLGPNVWEREGACWYVDPTKPVNYETKGTAGDHPEKQRTILAQYERNKAAGWAGKVKDWAGRWRGKTVVVLGNGPSVARNAKALRRFKDVVILATNRAPDLIDEEAVEFVDAWVLVDHVFSVQYLKDIARYRRIPVLFAETGTNTDLVDFFGRDRVVWFGPTSVPPGRERQLEGTAETGGFAVEMTVTNAAATLAYHNGADSVVFLGCDSCYQPAEPIPWSRDLRIRNATRGPGSSPEWHVEIHDSATGKGFPVERYPGRFQPARAAGDIDASRLYLACDLRGNAVVTEALMDLPARQQCAFAWFQRRAARDRRPFIHCLNGTGAGMMYSRHEAMIQVDFPAFAERFLEAA